MAKNHIIMKRFALFFVLLSVSLMSLAQVPANVPTNGLVAYYGFDGNANDLSGNGNNGTLGCAAGASNPTLAADRFGAANKAYEFGGIDNRNWIKVTNSASLQFGTEMSVSFWMLQSSARGEYIAPGNSNVQTVNSNAFFTVVAKGGVGNPQGVTPPVSAGWRVQSSWDVSGSGTQMFDWTNTNTTLASINTGVTSSKNCYSAGEWVHVVFAVKTGTCRIYINGTLYNEANGMNPNFTIANNSDMYIGRLAGGDLVYFPFSGRIDDVAIYNRCIDDSDVAGLYNDYNGTSNRISVSSVAVVNPCGANNGTITITPRQQSGMTYTYALSTPNTAQASNVLQAGPGTHRCYVISQCDIWDTVITLRCDCTDDPSLVQHEYVCPGESGTRGGLTTIFTDNFNRSDVSDKWLTGSYVYGSEQWHSDIGEPNYMWADLYYPARPPRNGSRALYSATYWGYWYTTSADVISKGINISCDPSRVNFKFVYMAESMQVDYYSGSNTLTLYYSTSQSGPWTQLWSSGGRDVGSWTTVNQSLASLPGSGTYYFKFNNRGSGYVSGLDLVEITCDNRYTIPARVTQAAGGDTVQISTTLENTGLCPITETTIWHIWPTTHSYDTQYAAFSYTWPVNGQTYTRSGDYNKAGFRNSHGCDSTAHLHLIIDINTRTHIYDTVCDSYTWNGTGRTYTTSTFDSTRCPACNRFGGDSTTYLHLVVNRSDSYSFDTISCTPYQWQGEQYDSSFTAMAHLYTTVGHCDSLVTVRFTRHYPDETYVVDTACGDETYYFAGTVLDHSGDFTARLRNIYLCDSTVHLNLSYYPVYDFPPMVDSVPQDSLPYTGYYHITGQEYTYELHNELVHFSALGGCDSNYHLTLIIRYKIAECDDHLQFPNLITPNGDNHNDRFYIIGIDEGCWPENELVIYNRWGGKVFSLRNIKSGLDCWEPTTQPSGTYYYRFQGRSPRGTTERFGVVEVVK